MWTAEFLPDSQISSDGWIRHISKRLSLSTYPASLTLIYWPCTNNAIHLTSKISLACSYYILFSLFLTNQTHSQDIKTRAKQMSRLHLATASTHALKIRYTVMDLKNSASRKQGNTFCIPKRTLGMCLFRTRTRTRNTRQCPFPETSANVRGMTLWKGNTVHLEKKTFRKADLCNMLGLCDTIH